MTTDPDQIRDEIRQTRANLSADIDALAYKASPSRMVHERTDRVRGALRGMTDKVMGAASDVGDRAGAATSAVAEATSTLADTAEATAGKVKRAAEGNPLAAGLVVFGAAWLVSSLMPGSDREREVALAVKTAVQDHAGPVTEALSGAAHEMQEHLREPVRDAAEAVKVTAVDAAQAVKDDGIVAAEEVRDSAARAREDVTR